MYEMIVGPLPFGESSTDPLETFRETLEKPLNIPKYVKENAGDILRCLLERMPEQRLGSSTMHWRNEVREHSFFGGLQWHAILEHSTVPPYVPAKKEKQSSSSIAPAPKLGRLNTTPDLAGVAEHEVLRGDESGLLASAALDDTNLCHQRSITITSDPFAIEAEPREESTDDEEFLPPDPGADVSCFASF